MIKNMFLNLRFLKAKEMTREIWNFKFWQTGIKEGCAAEDCGRTINKMKMINFY
jgi:hypothetical protein